MRRFWWLVLVGLRATCAAVDPTTPRLEAALFLPQPNGVALRDHNVTYNAQYGLAIVTQVRSEALATFLDGEAGRLITTGALAVSTGPTSLTLPMDSGELTYQALRAGRPTQVTVPNPASVKVELQAAQPSALGALVRLDLTVTRLREPVEPGAARAGADPVFTERKVTVSLSLSYGQPTLLLLETGQPGLANSTGVMFRQQVGNSLLEANAPMVGVVLNLQRAGAAPYFEHLTAPLAKPGQVRVGGEVAQEQSLAFRAGLRASEVVTQAGVTPGAMGRVYLRRLSAAGAVEKHVVDPLPTPGSAQDFPVRERDNLYVELGPVHPPAMARAMRPGAPAAAKSANPAVGEAFAGPQPSLGMPYAIAPAGQPGPQGPAGAPGLAGAPAPLGAQAPLEPALIPRAMVADAQASRTTLSRSLSLDELQQVQPAVAKAALAAVAVTGRPLDGDKDRKIRLCGTLVREWGLVLTGPAASLRKLTDLKVTLSDGRQYDCRVDKEDATHSLLALRLVTASGGRPQGLPWLLPVTLLPPVGSPLVVLGDPYGLNKSVSLTVVAGPLRQLKSANGAQLQLDGQLALGNSGGPVVGLDGNLVGIAYGSVQPLEPGPAFSLAVPYSVINAFLTQYPR